jgi:regulatory protein
MELSQKKFYTPEQAMNKAMAYCAYQERCHKEVKNKLYEWGLYKKDVEEICSRLITEGYLNEERFAIAFAGGKFRIKKWGRIRIIKELELRGVSPYCIRKGLQEIPDKDYRKLISKYVTDKKKEVKESNPLKKRYKIASFIISKGFEPEWVWEALKEDED